MKSMLLISQITSQGKLLDIAIDPFQKFTTDSPLEYENHLILMSVSVLIQRLLLGKGPFTPSEIGREIENFV